MSGHPEYKVWFEEHDAEGLVMEHSVNINWVSTRTEAVDSAQAYLDAMAESLSSQSKFKFSMIQTPFGDFRKAEGEWVRI